MQKTKEEFLKECETALVQCVKLGFHKTERDGQIEYHTFLNANTTVPYWRPFMLDGREEDFEIEKKDVERLLFHMCNLKGIKVMIDGKNADETKLQLLCELAIENYIQKRLNEWKLQ